MNYEVILSEDAIQDIFEIYYYISVNDSFDKADKLRNEIYEKCSTLSSLPNLGIKIKEILDERPDLFQIFLNPYNIIYKIENMKVVTLAVIDGRQDLNIIYNERFLGK